MSYPIESKNIDHLKKMQVGDIWLDKYGDYLLILDVDKINHRSKNKRFYIFVGAMLLTNFSNDAEVEAGTYIEDFIPEYIMEKIA